MPRATLDPLTVPDGVVLAVRLMDEESLLACAAYVDLNPIRAAMADRLDVSDHTSVQRRIEVQRAEAVGSDDEPGRLSAHRSGELAYGLPPNQRATRRSGEWDTSAPVSLIMDGPQWIWRETIGHPAEHGGSTVNGVAPSVGKVEAGTQTPMRRPRPLGR